MTTAGTGVLGELLRSLEGLRNRKAITLLMVGFILGVILLGIGTRVGLDSFALGFVFGLIGLLCVLFGISAAGIVLMDATRGRPETSYGDAMLLGVLTFLKLLLGVIALLLALFGVHLVVVALLYVCKIPGIGPLLFAILLPVMLLTMALVYLGAGACFSLLAPALWDGNTLGSAFARVYAVGSNRPIQFIIAWLVTAVLLGFVFLVLFGVLTSATLGVGSLSVAILGTDVRSLGIGGLSGFGGPFGLGQGGGGGAGYVIAGIFGLSVAWAIMFAAVGAVALMAMCIVYVGLIEGLDIKQAEQYLADRISQAREKAAQMQEMAKQRAQEAQSRARQAAEQRASATTPGVGAAPPTGVVRCPACGAQAEASSVFCEECGKKL